MLSRSAHLLEDCSEWALRRQDLVRLWIQSSESLSAVFLGSLLSEAGSMKWIKARSRLTTKSMHLKIFVSCRLQLAACVLG